MYILLQFCSYLQNGACAEVDMGVICAVFAHSSTPISYLSARTYKRRRRDVTISRDLLSRKQRRSRDGACSPADWAADPIILTVLSW